MKRLNSNGRFTREGQAEHTAFSAAEHTQRRNEVFRFRKRINRLPLKGMSFSTLVQLGLVKEHD